MPPRAMPRTPKPPPVPERPPVAGQRWEVKIDGYRPASLNEIMHGHWARGAALKKRDRIAMGLAFAISGVPAATGKRRVSLRITLPKGSRRHDIDAFLKTTLDACVHAKILIDDNPKWAVWGGVFYERGEQLSTTIIVEDIS